MSPVIKIVLQEVEPDFFLGTTSELKKKLEDLEKQTGGQGEIRIDANYYGHNGECDYIISHIRPMTSEEFIAYEMKKQEVAEREKKQKNDKRAKDIMKKKSKGGKISEADKKFMMKYMEEN